MIKVCCVVPNHNDPKEDDMCVESHWNNREYVVVIIMGRKYIVKGSDLKAAIESATNINRHG